MTERNEAEAHASIQHAVDSGPGRHWPTRDLVAEASAALAENPRNKFAADVLRLSIEERQRRDVGTTIDKPHGPGSARDMNRFYRAERRRWMVPRWVGFLVLVVYAGLWVWAFWHVGPRG